jgi:hypothetical protein
MAKERLDSWKSIAGYLKRSPRTVQRWSGEYGLPVHHFGGGKGPVFAYAEELDAWLSGFVQPNGNEQFASDENIEARKGRSLELTADACEMWELCSEENLGRIAGLFRRAIDRYPGNAQAFIGLANAVTLAALLGVMRTSAAYPRAVEALQRAMRLQFEPLEAQCASAWLEMVHRRKWRQARDGFNEVLSKRPGSSHALSGQGLMHVAGGNLPLAAYCVQEAWERNTFASALNVLRCWVAYLSGDFERALELAAQARASGDHGSVSAAIEALALTQAGSVVRNLKRVEAIAGEFPQSLVLQGALGYAYAVSDQTGRAWKTIQSLQRMQGDSAYPQALVLTGLEEKHMAISNLEASYAEGSLWSLGLRFDPILNPLRDHPRFAALLRKLPEPV